MSDNDEKKTEKTYDTESLSRYAKLVTDGLLEASMDDRAVQGIVADTSVNLESMTVLKFSTEDSNGEEKEKAQIKVSGKISIKTEES